MTLPLKFLLFLWRKWYINTDSRGRGGKHQELDHLSVSDHMQPAIKLSKSQTNEGHNKNIGRSHHIVKQKKNLNTKKLNFNQWRKLCKWRKNLNYTMGAERRG